MEIKFGLHSQKKLFDYPLEQSALFCYIFNTCRLGGMVDTKDSKSFARERV